MSPEELKAIVDTLILIAFTAGVLIEVLKLWARIQEYRKAKWSVPFLIWRELVFFTGLAIPFVAIFAVRAAEATSSVRSEIWWSLFTGLPAVTGIWFWLWVEFFKIRHDEMPAAPPPNHSERKG